MSLLDDPTFQAQPGIAQGRRIDEILVALYAALVRLELYEESLRAQVTVSEVLARALDSMLEEDERTALHRALDVQVAIRDRLRAEVDDAITKVKDAAERSKSHGSTALEAYLQKLKDDKRGEWIPPRGTARDPNSKRIPAGVSVQQLDKDGRVWTQNPSNSDAVDHLTHTIEAIADAAAPPSRRER